MAMANERPDDDDRVSEWDRDAWHELNLVDRNTRNEASWGRWALKMLALALIVPLVLGILAFLLILAV